MFEWDEQWKNKAKVISLRNANGEEVNVVLQSKIVLQEKITNGSMFSFRIYGKEGEEKIQTNREYVVGKRLEYNGTIYKVLQAHTSQETWTPPDAPSLFAKVLIPDSSTVPEWEQPDSTNPYAKGDKVTHNGKTWISTADGNVWEPGVYGWEEV